MNSIFTSLSEHSGELILFLILVCAILSFLTVKAVRNAASVRNRFRELLDGAKGETLERLLTNHLAERMRIQADMDRLGARVAELENKMKRTKRHLGVVRYDAFEDVGGAQSFALALYDDEGDGAVINSLVGRTDCRVYCKSLAGGKPDRSLSKEEEGAVERAGSKQTAGTS